MNFYFQITVIGNFAYQENAKLKQRLQKLMITIPLRCEQQSTFIGENNHAEGPCEHAK